MSWKFGGIYFKKDYSADTDILFKDLEYNYNYSGQTVTLEEAVQSNYAGAAVGIVNGRTLLHNNFIPYDCAFEPGKWYDMDVTLKKLSLENDIFCFFIDGATESYGLSYFHQGNRIRCRGVFLGKVVLDEGQSLPGEIAKEVMDEEKRIFGLIEVFIQASFSDLIQNRFFTLLNYKKNF